MEIDLQGLITGLVGVTGGGLGVGWIAKTFFSNYIKTNDTKHDNAHNERKEILKQLSSLNTAVAVINTRLETFNGIGKDVIILQTDMKKVTKDMNAAHARLREMQQ